MENTIFYFRKYENGISQIRKRTEKYRKQNMTVREKFRPFSSLGPMGGGGARHCQVGRRPHVVSAMGRGASGEEIESHWDKQRCGRDAESRRDCGWSTEAEENRWSGDDGGRWQPGSLRRHSTDEEWRPTSFMGYHEADVEGVDCGANGDGQCGSGSIRERRWCD
jgi:hypothetical protein